MYRLWREEFHLSMIIFTHAEDVIVLVGNVEDEDIFFDTLHNFASAARAAINMKSKVLWVGG